MIVAYCDDSEQARKQLDAELRRFALIEGLHMESREYASGDALLSDLMQQKQEVDLLLLDIFMEGINGMELAKRLRSQGYAGEIIFTTSSPDYALEGYRVAAVGYLLKPYTHEQFEAAMHSACLRLRGSLKALCVISDRVERHIPYRNILYVEPEGRYSMLRTAEERIRCRISLQECEGILCREPNFLRCHRSCIVNLNHISAPYPDYILMKNGERVMLSIKESVKIRQAIADYYFSLMKEL